MAPKTLLIFADDWGRHPSSCQHLTKHLLERHAVFWVNTIGTRRPRLDLDTLRRAWQKVRQWTRPRIADERLPAGLRILHPRMWPWFGSRLSRRLNRRLLARQLVPVIQSLTGPVVAVTTIPVVADLVGVLPVQRWVYYCVDDFSAWPGLDGATLRQMEEALVRKVDAVIAVSETLQEKLARAGRDAPLLTHGVDLEFWQTSQPAAGLPDLDGLERPLVVFWGIIDRRMDVACVQRLAGALQAGTIVLAGPEANPDPALFAAGRVVRLGRLPLEQLPGLARAAAVLIMPYADLTVTRAMQPLKLKEYLATDRPVVARDLPAVLPWADCLDVAGTPESFVAAVRLRLAEGLPATQQQARARLSEESWAAKARTFERCVL